MGTTTIYVLKTTIPECKMQARHRGYKGQTLIESCATILLLASSNCSFSSCMLMCRDVAAANNPLTF
jgi:hypothetical protein